MEKPKQKRQRKIKMNPEFQAMENGIWFLQKQIDTYDQMIVNLQKRRAEFFENQTKMKTELNRMKLHE